MATLLFHANHLLLLCSEEILAVETHGFAIRKMIYNVRPPT